MFDGAVPRALAANRVEEVADHVPPGLDRKPDLVLAAVVGLELLLEVAVELEEGLAGQVHRAVVAIDGVGPLRVVGQLADEQDRELRVIDGQEERSGMSRSSFST